MMWYKCSIKILRTLNTALLIIYLEIFNGVDSSLLDMLVFNFIRKIASEVLADLDGVFLMELT